MTTIPPAFADHLAGVATTTCHAWIVRRRDGMVLGFTDHDRPLRVSGVPCEPATGMVASEVEATLGLASDTAEVAGALSSDTITEADIVAGRYDGATVDLHLVNWSNPDQAVLLRRAVCGEIVRSDGMFRVELRGLQSLLDRSSGRAYLRRCDAELGDARCGVDALAPAFQASGEVVSAADNISIEALALAAFADGWFGNGRLNWTSGANAGLQTSVIRHQGAHLILRRAAPLEIQPGDRFTVTAGCDKAFSTCREKFNNHINFRGFPHVPGTEAALAYVNGEDAYDGRPLVP